MIIIPKKDYDKAQLDNLIDWLTDKGVKVNVSKGENTTVLGLIGDTSKIDIDLIRSLDVVEDVKRIQEPFKNANRKFHPQDTVVNVSGAKIGGGNFQFIAGPCSVESEEQIIERLTSVISQLIAHEKEARRTLLERDQYGLLDYVGRSYGILRHSYKLSSEEAIKSLSGLRVGVDMGLFNSVGIRKVNELFIAIGAAHLQKSAGRELSAAERDICRAALCREKLKHS